MLVEAARLHSNAQTLVAGHCRLMVMHVLAMVWIRTALMHMPEPSGQAGLQGLALEQDHREMMLLRSAYRRGLLLMKSFLPRPRGQMPLSAVTVQLAMVLMRAVTYGGQGGEMMSSSSEVVLQKCLRASSRSSMSCMVQTVITGIGTPSSLGESSA